MADENQFLPQKLADYLRACETRIEKTAFGVFSGSLWSLIQIRDELQIGGAVHFFIKSEIASPSRSLRGTLIHCQASKFSFENRMLFGRRLFCVP